MNNCELISKSTIINYIKNCKAIIWDFDGVIKDSVEVKGKVFKELFPNQRNEVKDKIYNHHKSNGGISRYSKIKRYLDWSSYQNNDANLEFFSNKFSTLVKEEVIKSNYIEGIYDYLKNYYERQNFYLVTAIPQDEISEITRKLKISSFFKNILGYPKSKEECFELILKESQLSIKDFIAVGDSLNEYKASKKFNLKFILRMDKSENKIPQWYPKKGLIINDFISEKDI